MKRLHADARQGRLQGEMTGERDGVVRGRAKIDAAKNGSGK